MKEHPAARGFVGMHLPPTASAFPPAPCRSRRIRHALALLAGGALLIATAHASEASPTAAPRAGLRPWIALILLVGLAAPFLHAEDYGRTYRSSRLENGCLPSAFMYRDGFHRRFPAEHIEVMLLELPDENGALYGHGVAVFSQHGRLFMWDHEFGQLDLDVAPGAEKDALRAAVIRSYQQAVALFQAESPAIRAFRAESAKRKTGEAACKLVAASLAERQAVLVSYQCEKKRRHLAVAFLGGGLVWVYTPEVGAAFTRIDPGQNYDQLIVRALQTQFSRVEIIRPAKT